MTRLRVVGCSFFFGRRGGLVFVFPLFFFWISSLFVVFFSIFSFYFSPQVYSLPNSLPCEAK